MKKIFYLIILFYSTLYAGKNYEVDIYGNIRSSGTLTIGGEVNFSSSTFIKKDLIVNDKIFSGSIFSNNCSFKDVKLNVISSSTTGKIDFTHNIDLNLKEIKNVILENLSSYPVGVGGRIFYNTSDGTFYWYDGNEWRNVATSTNSLNLSIDKAYPKFTMVHRLSGYLQNYLTLFGTDKQFLIEYTEKWFPEGKLTLSSNRDFEIISSTPNSKLYIKTETVISSKTIIGSMILDNNLISCQSPFYINGNSYLNITSPYVKITNAAANIDLTNTGNILIQPKTGYITENIGNFKTQGLSSNYIDVSTVNVKYYIETSSIVFRNNGMILDKNLISCQSPFYINGNSYLNIGSRYLKLASGPNASIVLQNIGDISIRPQNGYNVVIETGNLVMSGGKVVQISTPTAWNDAVNKGYVDDKLTTIYITTASGSISIINQTSYVDMLGAQITINLKYNSYVEIIFDTQFTGTNDAGHYIGLFINEILQTFKSVGVRGTSVPQFSVPFTLSYSKYLTPGTYTIKIKWRNASTNTTITQDVSGGTRTLIVKVFPSN